jgi:anti-sigma regulatory factor (Ser/Thr protein kinase)
MSAPSRARRRADGRRGNGRRDVSGGDGRGEGVDELSTVFPSVAPSASGARRFVAAALRRWQCADDVVDLALLLTSELVTNAYRHAGTETRVSVRRDDQCVHVEVRDVGPGEPELRPHDTDRVDGRGLQIVDALAHRWGYESSERGTAVWFDLVHPA